MRVQPGRVEQVRAEVAHILSAWWVSEGEESPEQLAERILAALDPPGREQALREENERERELREANARECDRLSAVVDELGVALNTAAAERSPWPSLAAWPWRARSCSCTAW